MNSRQVKNNQVIIDNIWTSTTPKIQCLCPKPPSKLEDHKKLQTCYRCNMEYHSQCFWPPEKGELFQCPFCYIKYCFPHQEVRQILFGGYIPVLKKDKVEYKINFTLDPKIKANKSVYLQARCIKFNYKNRYEISWPDNATFSLGRVKLTQFKPLQTNSPLKRRQDQSIKLDKARLMPQNQIVIEQKSVPESGYKLNKKVYHLVAVMVISELSNEAILSNYQNRMLSIKESKDALRDYMNHQSGDITIEKISISLRCQLYGSRMKLPARSRICTTHIQPFDLMNFINASIHAKVAVKKWKCPICDKRAYDLVIDKYILDLMAQNQTANEIIFRQDGQPEMIQGNEDSKSQQDDNEEIEDYRKQILNRPPQVIDLDDGEDIENVGNENELVSKASKMNLVQQLSQQDEINLKGLQWQQKAKQAPAHKRQLIIKSGEDECQNTIKKARVLNNMQIEFADRSKNAQKFGSNFNIISLDDNSDEEENTVSKIILLPPSKKAQKQKQKQKSTTSTSKKPFATLDFKQKKSTEQFTKQKPAEIRQNEYNTEPFGQLNQSSTRNFLSAQSKPTNKNKSNINQKLQQPKAIVIEIDSDEPQTQSSKQIEKQLTDIMIRHKKGMQKQGKAYIMDEDTQIFEGLFSKVMEISQLF